MDVDDRVEDFELLDQSGSPRRLSEFLSKGRVVLFFYPGAMTRGCTAESCHFRDLAAEFEQLNAQRVGISPDPVDKQARFAELNSFDYPLLSDPTGEIARRFNVRRPFGPLKTRRWTFVIDVDSSVLAVIKSETNMAEHADAALAALRAAA